ncbi:alpha-L-fucosidase 1-like isoform X1 [Selaginella moellendorffii]|uniref:alpha-L-fucosidase 1-like isoform X1 n=1 Tax=Selaginella moellendorffii TaxID=88036 RepID=UPI000D1CCFB2|nr:alpha-L-fucosidase 1-like isoform X1 [Selaginella moellendorffii]|eukprot:XP_024532338.1 alpha-L-fucosidase 1-like isoform X1 [Selaginella moellendorffii]
MNFHLSFLLLEILVFLRAVALNSPPPLRPIPSWRQLQFNSRRLSMFFHFGVNTFTDSERGSGHESPSIFNPERSNASQWMDAAQSAGAQLVILTVNHHDGFCLWPSAYTNFSVAGSSWRGGKGDVVAEFVAAARERGLDVDVAFTSRHGICTRAAMATLFSTTSSTWLSSESFLLDMGRSPRCGWMVRNHPLQ